MVDLFGALPREALEQAVRELAFRRGTEFDPDAHAAAVAAALEGYQLVAVEAPDGDATDDADGDDADRLVPGPTAFPTLPEHGDDLPHILDRERRSVDRETAGEAAERRLRAEAARAVAADDHDRVRTLLDVSYDLETWAPVDAAGARDRLDAALETDADGSGDGT